MRALLGLRGGEMICPMKFSSNYSDEECEQKKCAWWSEKYERCWIVVESYEERASLICHQAIRDRK